MKEPSPLVKPEIHKGFKTWILFVTLVFSNSTLGKGPNCSNLSKRDGDIDLFNLLTNEASVKNPEILVWTFLFIWLSISQKYEKFRALVVCKRYLLKWAIIILSSDLDLTLNRASLPTIETVPTEKKFLIEVNYSKSLTCKVIIEQGSIVQPIAAVFDLYRDIAKEPSAPTKPVTHQRFKVSDIFGLLVLLYLTCLVRVLFLKSKLEGNFEDIRIFT